MEAKSIWHYAGKDSFKFPTQPHNLETDIVIIGGGITGVTAALHLMDQGKKVIILEADEIGGYTTGSSTGNLYIPIQSYYHTLVSKYDENMAKAIAHARKFAIDFIENIVRTKNIDCNFSRRPWFFYTNDDDHIKELEQEVETLNQLEIEMDYVSDLTLDLKFKKAARLQNQARFNPLKYVRGLANHLQENGCLIFEHSRALNLKENKNNCLVETVHGTITAKKVIIATHTPIGIYPVQMFIAPYRSYAIATRIENKSLQEGHYWDLNNPHHSIATHAVFEDELDVLMIAGNHHKTGQAKDNLSYYKPLQHFLKKEFKLEKIDYQWSAQHYQAADYKPYIGLADRFKKHVYMATGYFADGLVYGSLAGIILADLLAEKENPMFTLFNSTRLNFTVAFGSFLKENTNVLFQYLKDYPFLERKNISDDLRPGEGKIVEIDREKWAVCKDEHNKVHMVSAVCTHMKCIVAWNNAEKSWDCPCHGSRFSPDGQVLEGPALSNLEPKHQS